jgi:SAM-dependent methyltransferase
VNVKIESLSACPVCNQTRLRTLMQVPDFETGTGEYGLVECGDCGLAFTSPRPLESELPMLYADRTTTDFPNAHATIVQRVRENAIDSYLARELGTIQKTSHTPFTVLDFGCGDGALALGLLRHARACGAIAQVTAVDFHSDVPASLVGADASKVRYLSHTSWRETGERYDAVFLRHVLEHHPDPRRLLSRLSRMLRPGGRLFVEVPNRRSVWAAVFGRYYFGYYIPRHLMHFDRRSLRLAAETSGLRCVSLRLGHTPLLGHSLAYRTGWNIGNLGLIGLASYPLQVAVDALGRTSSTLRLVAAPDD